MSVSGQLIDDQGVSHPLAEAITIGRSSTCDIVIDDPRVSRLHAVVSVVGGQVVVEDKSTNGTFVNGRRIATPTYLNNNDLLSLPAWECRLTIDAADPPPVVAPPIVQEQVRPEREQPAAEQREGRRWLLVVVPVVLALAILAGVIYMGMSKPASDSSLDADLCPPPDQIAAVAVLLMDLRDPISGSGRVDDLLRQISRPLDKNTELRVFALSGTTRDTLDRLCKPYDQSSIDLVTKGPQPSNECGDLPAQISPEVRSGATGHCLRLQELAARLQRLSGRYGGRGANHLMEALEDTLLELAQEGRKSLFLFSDMLQHSPWYSHIDQDWLNWSYDEYAARRSSLDAQLGGAQPTADGVEVTVYYIPRRGFTDQPRIARAHKRFWERYFGSTEVSFEDQATMDAYAAPQLGPPQTFDGGQN